VTVARRRAAIAAGVLVFLLVSVVVARWLSAEGAERDQVERLLNAQVRGDAAAMAREIGGCEATCERRMATLAARLKGPGDLEIVRYDSHTAHALGAKTAPTRVVWQRTGQLTTVQCVRVRRTGNAVTGPTVTLLGLSAPIEREAGC
jgi:hypothetical protein